MIMTTIELGFISITGIWGLTLMIGFHLGKSKAKHYKQQLEIKEYELKIQKTLNEKTQLERDNSKEELIGVENALQEANDQILILTEENEKLEYYKNLDETILKKQLEREQKITNNLNSITSYTGEEKSDVNE